MTPPVLTVRGLRKAFTLHFQGGTRIPVHKAELLGLLEGLDAVRASHDDTTPGHVAEGRAMGVTISEFPTTLEAAEAARASGMGIVAGGPNLVIGGSHSGNVAAAELARAGLLDAFSSDYVPASLLQAAFLLAGPGFGWALPKAVATVTRNPADLSASPTAAGSSRGRAPTSCGCARSAARRRRERCGGRGCGSPEGPVSPPARARPPDVP